MTDSLRDRIAAVLGKWVANWLALKMADAVIEALDDDFVDFGLWLAEEITGRNMTRIDLESCLADWKGEP